VKAALDIPVEQEIREAVKAEVDHRLGGGGYLNKRSAAVYLDTSPGAIIKMVERGQLHPVRRRPHYVFSRSELDRWALGEAA
jgi:Helix-turn-helix domain